MTQSSQRVSRSFTESPGEAVNAAVKTVVCRAVDLSHVQPLSKFRGQDPDDGKLCRDLFDEATAYITSFHWCASVTERYVADCVGGIFALVLFHIEPAKSDVDEWIWVVVGDLPPAYIAPASADPRDALGDYIEQMSKWVQAVSEGSSTDGLIPVNTPPTVEWADLLNRRLDFLKREILPTVGRQRG
jgi:hypothetical protein